MTTPSPATRERQRDGMAWIPGGTFAMGSEEFYPEERPVHEVAVEGFWIDERPVTVARVPPLRQGDRLRDRWPSASPTPPTTRTPTRSCSSPARSSSSRAAAPWPSTTTATGGPTCPGACWRRPEGPGSDTYTRARHPVTHIAYEDAVAYAEWAGKALPTEAEWERAARGGLEGARFAWGDDETPGGERMANTWQGEFPWQNTLADGFAGTSPVGAFPPNGFGLYDVCGNVWEWTTRPLRGAHDRPPRQAAARPRREDGFPRLVIKGGSHLCAPSYCLRYRPAARQGQAIDSSTSHLGFRCVVRPG